MKLNEMARKPTTKQLNRVMESRFGFAIDYDSLTMKKAYKMATAITEGLAAIKNSHGIHTAEKHPKYMEMLMVRESLHRWMVENKQRYLAESEMAKSEAILAAKDMVDSIQDMLEKVSKMQNEQMPALLDTVRDQLGIEKADGFKNAVTPLLSQLAQTLQSGRETVDGAARSLAGEEGAMGAGDMGVGMQGGAPDPLAGDEMSAPGMDSSDFDSDEGMGNFAATDAAAGGPDVLGREQR